VVADGPDGTGRLLEGAVDAVGVPDDVVVAEAVAEPEAEAEAERLVEGVSTGVGFCWPRTTKATAVRVRTRAASTTQTHRRGARERTDPAVPAGLSSGSGVEDGGTNSGPLLSSLVFSAMSFSFMIPPQIGRRPSYPWSARHMLAGLLAPVRRGGHAQTGGQGTQPTHDETLTVGPLAQRAPHPP
jgi:hypothetical protein